MGWAIALHGGAGDIPADLPQAKRAPREATLRRCLDLGVAAFQARRSPLDVVELLVSFFTISFLLLLLIRISPT